MPRRLKNWIESYTHYTRLDEAPEQFHLWTSLAMLSAAVNRNCWMERGYGQTFPNLYILFLGPSGVGKSSASGIGISMLKTTPLQVHIFKDFITPAGLIEFMAGACVSTEIQGKIIHKTPILIYASELGTLLNPRSGVRELTLLLTELFNKPDDHEDRTGKRGKVLIRKPNVTFFACCFPEWIDEELMSVSLRSGFLGRMCVITGYKKRRLAPTIELTTDDIQLHKDLLNDLEHIGNLYGEMSWTPKAYKAWTDWYMSQPKDFSESDDAIEVKGFTARRAQFVQRLAMLHAIAQRDDALVDIPDLEFGKYHIDQCETNSRRLKLKSPHVILTNKTRMYILKLQAKMGDTIPIRDVAMRMHHHVANTKELDECIEQLCAIGFCELIGRKIKVLDPKIGAD